ncbi:MAG: hypothetical protein M3O31_13675 [Acidobacteriota bacterium]|nr:hypothetical protein [Acidobacteriota bacterium]
MPVGTPRILGAIAALISAAGGAMHAAAFPKAASAIDASGLAHFYAGSSKALWLADAATLILVGCIYALIAWRPGSISRPLAILVALIPAGTAVMLYSFLGPFIVGHLLLGITVLALIAAVQLPGTLPPQAHSPK